MLVCAVAVGAAFLLRAVGGPIYDDMRQEYTDAMSHSISVNQAIEELDALAVKHPFLSGIVEPIKSVQAFFQFSKDDSSASSASDSSAASFPSSSAESSQSANEATSQPSSEAPAASSAPADDASQLTGAGGEDLPASSSLSAEASAKVAPEGASFAPYFLTGSFYSPLSSGIITSDFGYRNHPKSGQAGFHKGLDIAADEGTPIACAMPGTISQMGEDETAGKFVLVDHAGGVQTFYGHCSEFVAQDGASVRAGETLALVGSTGDSTGPHVHLEIRINGVAHDPARLLESVYKHM
ncbi:M23 family metallopeptidase [Solibaculum mannosilyticum]|uniref:M23 family metallopeptidase n=1 Tax=Solibaculum mannosilyticum TaxID=2780922 RepID=UPI0034B670D2